MTPNSYNLGSLFEYWALAPAGTYEITVNYNDGNNAAILGHQVGNYSPVIDSPPVATFTATISNTGSTGIGAIVNVTRVLTGTLAVGQVIQGGTRLSGNHAYHIAKQNDGVPGGTGHYELNAYVDLDFGPIDYKAFNPVTNQVNAFAVTGANTKAPFDTGGPAYSWPAQFIGAAPTIVTKGGRDLVFGVVFIAARYSPDAGYTLMVSDANYAFMSQISSLPVAPGPQTGLTFGGACGFALIDAIVQAPGGSIALDGTPVYAKSGPYRNAQPTNVTTAQMSYDGTYWCVSGPESGSGEFTGASGGIWRYWNNGSTWQWERIDGSLSGMRGGVGFPTPVYISAGNAICVDPRKGREGNVVFTGPNKGWNGSQTTNGNAPLNSIIWRTNRSNRGIIQTLTSPVGWLNQGGPHPGGDGQQVGNMVLDPATGHYWQAGGKGVFEITTFNVGGPVVAIAQAQGIEEMLVQDFCTPPGSPTGTPLVGVEDEIVLNVDIPGYASAKPIPGDSNCWQMDYAGDDPSHVCCYAKGSINFGLSGYSTDYGKTWKPFAASPEGNLLGGCVAYVHSSGKIVCINQSGGGTAVRYSADTGASWHLSNGSPVTAYIGTPQIPYRLLAAERDGTNTVYLFAPNGDATHGAGVYKSTDGGANFSRTTGQPTGFPARVTVGPSTQRPVFQVTFGYRKSNTRTPRT